jgi:hypothetical protein
VGSLLWFIREVKHFLHSPNVSTDEAHLDPVLVEGRLREDVLNYASRQFARALIPLQNDIYLDSRANVPSVLTIHTAVKDNT